MVLMWSIWLYRFPKKEQVQRKAISEENPLALASAWDMSTGADCGKKRQEYSHPVMRNECRLSYRICLDWSAIVSSLSGTREAIALFLVETLFGMGR